MTGIPILVTTDASRLVTAFEAKIDAELSAHVETVLGAQPHIVSDYAVYRYEAGLIRGLREAKDMLAEAIKELATPEQQRSA